MSDVELMERVKAKMSEECLSLRTASQNTGLCHGTLHRALRGGVLADLTRHKLERWLEGGAAISRKATKRLKLAGKEFVITIEAI